MITEILFFSLMALSMAAIALASRAGATWLILCIPLSLIFTNLVSSKLILILNTTTTIGNASFVAIYLASDLLTEKGMKKEARTIIHGSFFILLIFFVLGHIAASIESISTTINFSQALDKIFHGSWRVIIASGLAYLLSATVNLWVFSYVRAREANPLLGSFAAAVVAYTIDQIVFVSIAFFGTIPNSIFGELLISGIFLKLLFATVEAFVFNKIRSA